MSKRKKSNKITKKKADLKRKNLLQYILDSIAHEQENTKEMKFWIKGNRYVVLKMKDARDG